MEVLNLHHPDSFKLIHHRECAVCSANISWKRAGVDTCGDRCQRIHKYGKPTADRKCAECEKSMGSLPMNAKYCQRPECVKERARKRQQKKRRSA